MKFRTLLTTASAVALSFGLAAGSAQAGSNNELFVEQAGNNNFAGGNQDGSDNQTYVSQPGNFNTAGAATDLTSFADSSNEALVYQPGSGNNAQWSFQGGPDSGAFMNNTLGIVQTTNNNFAGFKMKDTNGRSIQGTTIFVRQDGANSYVGNGAPITSSSVNNETGNSASNGATSQLRSAGVPSGDIHGSSVFNVADSGNQNASVHGDNNFFGLSQGGGSGNAFAVRVDGHDNMIGGPGGTTNLNPEGNTSGFFSDGTVEGPGPVTGLAEQDGSNNIGVVAQTGNFNAVSFKQVGFSNVNEVYQSGGGNFAVVHQN